MSLAVVVRHGETQNNKDLVFQGHNNSTGAQLTEHGRAQAKAVRDLLVPYSFDAVFASPLDRTRETAEIIVHGRNLPITFDDRLKEVDFGELEGKNLREYFQALGRNRENWWEENWTTPYPGGESFSQLFERVQSFAAMCREREDRNLLIVTHSTPLKMVLALMRGDDPRTVLPGYIPTCATYLAEKDGGEIWTTQRLYPTDDKQGYIT